MAFFDQTENQEAVPETTLKLTGNTGWFDVGANAAFSLELTVKNLSGTNPTLDWSIDHSADPANVNEAVTTLFQTTDFTQVAGAPFPNTQRAYFGVGDRNNLSKNSKRFIMVRWVLSGTNPVATVYVKVNKI